MREFRLLNLEALIRMSIPGFLRQLCKSASHHHPSTNVLLQDCTDLQKLAARLINMEQTGENAFRWV